MAGSGASGAVDHFERFTEDGRERERVVEAAVLHFTVNRGVTSGECFHRRDVGAGQQGNRRSRCHWLVTVGEGEDAEELSRAAGRLEIF